MIEKLNRAPGGRAKMLSEHVVYEIDMLRATFRRLEGPVTDALIANALIESFCIHARNLIDFFGGKAKPSADYAAASHFVISGYSPFSHGNPKTTVLYGKLNAQVAHLTYGRASGHEKIQAPDRKALIVEIEQEIENFASHLTKEYRAVWPKRLANENVRLNPAP